MSSPFRFDGAWVFPAGPDEVWEVLSRTDRFQEWWPWLRTLEGGGLVEGSVSHCVVRAPVPYALRFDVEVLEIVPRRLVLTSVSGDLEGPAWLELESHPEGSQARLSWELDLKATLLGAASRVARPLMEWGHNWVVDSGVRQFRQAAFDHD